MVLRKKAAPARLNPLECMICAHNKKCCFGLQCGEFYRLGLSIDLAHCALYNGGDVICADLVTEGGDHDPRGSESI